MRVISFKEARPKNQVMNWSEVITANPLEVVVSEPLTIDGMAGTVTISPINGAEASIETTSGTEAEVFAGEAIWSSWPKGATTVITTDTLLSDSNIVAIRCRIDGKAAGGSVKIQAVFGPGS